MIVSEHVKMLNSAGHSVSIVGANASILQEVLPVESCNYVLSRGSGAIYAPARLDRDGLAEVFRRTGPDVVIAEGWQTALTDGAVEVAHTLGIPVLMISHGSSVHGFTNRSADLLRAVGWLPYKYLVLPKLISRLSALATLDGVSVSRRFYDRDIARSLGVPVLTLRNMAVNWLSSFQELEQRKSQIVSVGYFSPIKNQLAAIEVLARLPLSIQLILIGQKAGRYYERCVHRVSSLKLTNRVVFKEDHECSIAEELASSLLVVAPSLTEALPVTLLEAMASGTPFVSAPVGAVPSLRGGRTASGIEETVETVRELLTDAQAWRRCSEEGRRQHAEEFSYGPVKSQLLSALEMASRPRVLNVSRQKYRMVAND